MRKVTKNQIEQLYTFVEKHYVEWYDVQTELVDHLANGIENQWEINTETSFDTALVNEFKKFGIYGFSDLVEEKTKALNKHYRKQVLLYLKPFLELPKIIITLFFVWALFRLMHFLDDKNLLMMGLVIVIFSVHVFHVIRIKKGINKRKKKTGKKWLFENNIIQLGGLIHFLNIGVWSQNLFASDGEWTTTTELIISTCIVLYLLIFFISVVIIPKKLKEKMSKQYPEYILS
ncbi:hypothetical protein GCM10022291_12050 [Postechiella marina]|uniref:Uncharacterized protein n=1 Tax=Postechiella marina TaxID=943941 RepID=A0ABP8C556_9FLAO